MPVSGRLALMMATSLFAVTMAMAQGSTDDVGTISGSIQMDAQSYTQDSVIGAPNVPEKILSNTFANILYTRGKFTAGIRFDFSRNHVKELMAFVMNEYDLLK